MRIKDEQEQMTERGEAEMSKAMLWTAVEREAARGSPRFESEVPDIVKYVELQSGQHGERLKEITSFSRTLLQPRVISGHSLKAVATAVMGEDGHGCLLFRQDMLRAMASASAQYATGDQMQTLLSETDITKLAKSPLTALADKMKGQGLELLKQHGLEMKGAVMASTHLFGIRLVHHVAQKPDKTRGKFESLHDIGHTFVQEIANITGAQLLSPWKPSGSPAETMETAHAPAEKTFKQFDSDGSVDRGQLFAEKGISVGNHVRNIKAKETYRITMVDASDQLVLQHATKPDISLRLAAAHFLKALTQGEYKVVPTPADNEKEIIADWATTANPTKTMEWHERVAAASVLLALEQLACEHGNDELESMVDIVTKPVKDKGVYAKKDIEKGGLTFVPLTTTIAAKSMMPKDAILLSLTLPNGAPLALLRPATTMAKEGEHGDKARGTHEKKSVEGSAAHFWLLADCTSAAKAETNMEMVSEVVPIRVGEKSKLTSRTLKIPVYRNREAVKAGAKLVLMKSSATGKRGAAAGKGEAKRPKCG